MISRLRFAVSGWDHPHWVGNVYPAGRDVDRLRATAAFCDTLEIASTAERLPSRGAAEAWSRVGTFEGVRFTAIAPKRILEHAGDDAPRFLEAMRPLTEANVLLAVVIVIPQYMHHTPDAARRLKRAIDSLSPLRPAVEPRHESWRAERVTGWLDERGVALVNVDQPALPGAMLGPAGFTRPLTCVRLHGRNRAAWFATGLADDDERYDYVYSTEELAPWVDAVKRESERGVRVIVTACNVFGGNALGTLAKLRAMCGGEPPACPEPVFARDPELARLGAVPVPLRARAGDDG